MTRDPFAITLRDDDSGSVITGCYDPAHAKLIESARRLRLVWVALAGKCPPDEIQLAVALADLTAHLHALEVSEKKGSTER